MKSSQLAMIFLPLSVVAMAFAVWKAYDAPVDSGELIVQKIYYVHLPVIWTAYLAFSVGLVASIGFLKNRRRSWDRVAYASTEIGVLFCTLVLITGPIWAKPIWKVWWQWDGRLTATLVMWFTYVGYLAVRALAEDRAQAARWSAVLAIVAWLNIPIVHMSVKWWYSLHPQSKIFRERLGGGLEEGMGEALIAGLAAFSMVYLGLFFLRLTVERLSDEREERQVAS